MGALKLKNYFSSSKNVEKHFDFEYSVKYTNVQIKKHN